MEENWYPSKDDYDPEISAEQWKDFIADKNKNVFTAESLAAFACVQKASIATCSDMAEEFGRMKNFTTIRFGEQARKFIN